MKLKKTMLLIGASAMSATMFTASVGANLSEAPSSTELGENETKQIQKAVTGTEELKTADGYTFTFSLAVPDDGEAVVTIEDFQNIEPINKNAKAVAGKIKKAAAQKTTEAQRLVDTTKEALKEAIKGSLTKEVSESGKDKTVTVTKYSYNPTIEDLKLFATEQ
ncbi:hypothetical protein FACS189481_4880 [Clostridia bacterium]|nr:hypothetical protein FACS189481_4880 [Clostridia bacterium]